MSSRPTPRVKTYYKAIKSCPNSTVWILFGLNLHLFVIYFDGILFGKITIIKIAIKSCSNGTVWIWAIFYIRHHFFGILCDKDSLQSHQEFSEQYSDIILIFIIIVIIIASKDRVQRSCPKIAAKDRGQRSRHFLFFLILVFSIASLYLSAPSF